MKIEDFYTLIIGQEIYKEGHKDRITMLSINKYYHFPLSLRLESCNATTYNWQGICEFLSLEPPQYESPYGLKYEKHRIEISSIRRAMLLDFKLNNHWYRGKVSHVVLGSMLNDTAPMVDVIVIKQGGASISLPTKGLMAWIIQ